ncbi:MAG: response regulator [Anaerolineae bacterium]|jgi:CheY-like chemotaxis protein|nr:response regulator [Anaerolineae bacterium]
MAKILIVEDSDDLQFIFSWVFRSKGHSIESIQDGQEAMDYLAYYTPDVLLLDINLPNVSGLQIAHWVRQQTRFDDTKIIFVTGNQMYQSSPDAELADLFLLKPVDAPMLVQMADRLLSRREAKRQPA